MTRTNKNAAPAPPVEPELPVDIVPGDGPEDDDSDEGDPDGDDADDGDGNGEGDPDDGDADGPMHLASVSVPVGHFQEPPRAPPPPRQNGRARAARDHDDPEYRPIPPPDRRRGMMGPRGMTAEARSNSKAFKSAREKQEQAIAEIDSTMAGLNFEEREYEIRVKRLSPDVDENGTPCAGLLHTFHEKVTVAQIQNRFGGGTMEVSIFGPHPTTGNKCIIKREVFPIAGHPKPMPSYIDKKRDDDSLAEALKVVAETNERANDRLADMMERNAMQSANQPSPVKEIMPMFQAMMKKTDDTVALLMKQMEMANAQRDRERAELEAKESARREDARREEDRRRDEARREDEKRETRQREEREIERKREDQRREEERDRKEEERRIREEERRAEEKREDKKEQERLARERDIREETQRQREAERDRLREEAAEKQRQHERDLAAAERRMEQDAMRMKEFMTLSQNNSAAMLEFMTARMEGGGLESVAKQIEIYREILGENKEPSRLEEFKEGAEHIVSMVAPVAQQIMNARNGGQQMLTMQGQPGQQGQQPTGQRVLVDMPQRPALQAQNPAQPQPQPAQNTAPVEPATPDAKTTPVIDGAASGSGAAPGELKNDFTKFEMPDLQHGPQYAGIVLLKNIDLAIQKNMSAEDIVDNVLDPFEAHVEPAPWSQMIIGAVQNMDNPSLLAFIANEVVDPHTKQPLNWAILSPLGSERVVESFDLWKQDDDDDDGVPLGD